MGCDGSTDPLRLLAGKRREADRGMLLTLEVGMCLLVEEVEGSGREDLG